MRVRSIDGTGDWVFGTGLSAYKDLNDSVQQRLLCRLKEWNGDCWFDIDAGVDFVNYSKNQDLFDMQIKAIILNTDDVLQITSYQSTLNSDRSFSIEFEVQTRFSQSVLLSIDL